VSFARTTRVRNRLSGDCCGDRQLAGLKFRRQHPLGKYAVDFFCYELRLAIELDGSVHSQPSQMRKDAAKDGHLEARGFVF
jgi:very-short-patch-repair endonuclease